MEFRRGSFINYRNVLIESEVQAMDVIATENSIIFELQRDDLEFIVGQYPKVTRRVDFFINDILKVNQRYLIDVLPGHDP